MFVGDGCVISVSIDDAIFDTTELVGGRLCVVVDMSENLSGVGFGVSCVVIADADEGVADVLLDIGCTRELVANAAVVDGLTFLVEVTKMTDGSSDSEGGGATASWRSNKGETVPDIGRLAWCSVVCDCRGNSVLVVASTMVVEIYILWYLELGTGGERDRNMGERTK